MVTPARADKLDTTEVNGPQDDDLDWDAIYWRPVEDDVGRLRRRIFKASQEGDLKRVRNLQKLMLRSRSNTLVSVRRVTQHNAGRKTAGIDGEVALTSPDRAALAVDLHRHTSPWQARPVKRVYIPKANGKQRPLGIPVLRDRVQQARVANALEPEWEARFEPRCYGFRPGRGCHDAIEAIYWTLKGRRSKRQWVLDADLSAAFDRIDHTRLLAHLGSFPARGMVAGWLRAGVIENGRFTPTEEGTPQGGVVSPMLLNIALHGMEKAAGVRYTRRDPHGGARGGRLSGAGEVRRRLCRHVSHQGPGRTGLAPAGWVAGPERARVQRGQDTHRPRRARLRLLGVQRPSLRRQAADQAQPGGREANPESARRRGALP